MGTEDLRLVVELVTASGLVGAVVGYLKLRAQIRDHQAQRELDMVRLAHDAVQGVLNEREGDVKALRGEVAVLRKRIEGMEAALRRASLLERRLLSLLRQVLAALDGHDAAAAKAIRDENPDLDL